VTIPADTAPGAYYVIAKADADGVESETSETNNTYPRSIQIGSDLVVSAITMPAATGAGATITVGDTTLNHGGADAVASITRFYLSTNSTLDAGDTLLAASHSVPDLAAGASNTGAISITIPSDTPTGLRYIIAKADADNAVIETKETNNSLGHSIQIGPDLIVPAFTAPTKSGAGQTITVSETTVNQGGGLAVATATKFYLSNNAAYDVGDTLLGGRATPDLSPGASSTMSTALLIPATTAAGSYYIVARADGDTAVTETQEGNNTTARSVQVGADLVVSTVGAPPKGAAGASIVVTETTLNQGGGAAPATTTRFYLSSDGTLDGADAPLAGSHTAPDLPAGASSAGSTSVLIPAGTQPGTAYIIASADADDEVDETTETNNTRSRSISIGADFVIASVTVSSSSVAAGAVVNITDTVTNQGAQAAPSSTTRFYLSKNTTLDATDTLLIPGRSVPDLAGGVSHVGVTPVTIPLSATPGSYYMLAKADGEGAVAESVETNNVSSRAIQVTAGP
jgi:subtilase family serine protease